MSLIMPCLHYGNATLAGLLENQHHRQQSVLNAATRLIYRKSRCEHVTPLLQELHWLRSRERVDFQLAVLIFRRLHGLAPRYLADDIRRVADTNRRRLRSTWSALLTETNATSDHGRLPGRRQSTLEHSAARRHLCSHPACFL